MKTAAGAALIGLDRFRLGVGVEDSAADLTLRTSTGGCWGRFFGPCELPEDGALDVLERRAATWRHAPTWVEVVGSPAAALLPVMWLRSIWLEPTATIELHWPHVTPPGEDAREQLAAHLCRRLVAAVYCSEPVAAGELWGIDPGPVPPAGPDMFDAILGLIDCWDLSARGATNQFQADWLVRARAAFEACADRGHRRIGVYGAGTHTRALGPLFMEPRVEIVCIIDDSPAVQGGCLWGYPIVSRERAIELGVQAIVLSANSMEDRLWANSEVFRRAGIDVVRLYAAA